MNDGHPTADGPVLRIEDHRPEAIRIAHQAAELERLKRLQTDQHQERVSAEQGTSVVIAAASMTACPSPRSEHGAIITSLHESDSDPDQRGHASVHESIEHEQPEPAEVSNEQSSPVELDPASQEPAGDEAISDDKTSEIATEEAELTDEDALAATMAISEDAAAELSDEEPAQTDEATSAGAACADTGTAESDATITSDEADSTDEPIADEAAAPHLDEIAASDDAESTDAPELDSASLAAEAQPEAATCEAVDEASREPSADASQKEEPNITEATDEASGPRLADLDEAEQPSAALENPPEEQEQTETPENAGTSEDEDSQAAKAAAAAKIAEEEVEAQGLAFIEQIEKKHNQVLDELDALNARIESVLESYLSSRDGGDKGSQEDEKKAA